MNSGRVRLFFAFLLIVSIIAILVFLPTKDYLLKFVEHVRQMGAWGPAVMAGVYIVATVFFVPGSILTLGGGFIWGVPIGVATISVGSTLGASAAFLLGRTLLRKFIEEKVNQNQKFQAIDKAVGAQGFKIVLLTRLSPIFPFNLLNYSFGITRVSFRDYFLASWIGMLPGTAMYVYLGSALKSLADLSAGKFAGGTGQKLLYAFGLVITVIVTVYITRIARKALQDAVPAETTSTESPDGETAVE